MKNTAKKKKARSPSIFTEKERAVRFCHTDLEKSNDFSLCGIRNSAFSKPNRRIFGLFSACKIYTVLIFSVLDYVIKICV